MALLSPVAGDDVGNRVDPEMAKVQAARRIGKHGHDVRGLLLGRRGTAAARPVVVVVAVAGRRPPPPRPQGPPLVVQRGQIQPGRRSMRPGRGRWRSGAGPGPPRVGREAAGREAEAPGRGPTEGSHGGGSMRSARPSPANTWRSTQQGRPPARASSPEKRRSKEEENVAARGRRTGHWALCTGTRARRRAGAIAAGQSEVSAGFQPLQRETAFVASSMAVHRPVAKSAAVRFFGNSSPSTTEVHASPWWPLRAGKAWPVMGGTARARWRGRTDRLRASPGSLCFAPCPTLPGSGTQPGRPRNPPVRLSSTLPPRFIVQFAGAGFLDSHAAESQTVAHRPPTPSRRRATAVRPNLRLRSRLTAATRPLRQPVVAMPSSRMVLRS